MCVCVCVCVYVCILASPWKQFQLRQPFKCDAFVCVCMFVCVCVCMCVYVYVGMCGSQTMGGVIARPLSRATAGARRQNPRHTAKFDHKVLAAFVCMAYTHTYTHTHTHTHTHIHTLTTHTHTLTRACVCKWTQLVISIAKCASVYFVTELSEVPNG